MVGQEDFGLTGLESLSYGTPVAVHAQSGVAELVTSHQLGVHIQGESVESVKIALSQLMVKNWSKPKLIKQAYKYQTANFNKEMTTSLTELWQQHSKKTSSNRL